MKNPGVSAEVYTDPARNRGVIAEGGYLRTGDLGRHRRRRLHLDHRAGQGPDHPRRAQHRPGADRGRADAAPRGRLRRRDRPAGRARRASCRRSMSSWSPAATAERRGADRARPRPHRRAGGGAEAPRDPARAAEDRRRQGVQARPAAPGDRPGLRRGAGRGGIGGAGGRGGRGPPARAGRRAGAGPDGRDDAAGEVLGGFTVPWRWRDAVPLAPGSARAQVGGSGSAR